MNQSGYIELTGEGTALAEDVYERHTVLVEVLMEIGVSKETAVEDACIIEHDISDETFQKIKNRLNILKSNKKN